MKTLKQLGCAALATVSFAGACYAGLVSPAVPYFYSDMKEKRHTDQNNVMDYAKSVWGTFVWFPKNRWNDILSDREVKDFVVNKATQKLYIFDSDGNLEKEVATSTGKHRGIKRTEKQRVTPFGEYIAVRRFNKDDLKDWFGEEKAPKYGEGMLLFTGKWFPHIAVHGTLPEWEQYLGEERSMGCPRVDSETAAYIRDNVAIGSRMVVHEYAVLPSTASISLQEYAKNEGVKSGIALDDFFRNNPHVELLSEMEDGTTIFLKDYNGDGKVE